MEEKIYIIEQVNCRGEQTIEKYSFDREMFFSLLDLFSEDCYDEDGDGITFYEKAIRYGVIATKIREISKVDDWRLEGLLYNLIFGAEDFCGDDLSFEERIQAIKNGKYCAELEESNIAVGFSAKEAKGNLIELDEDEDW